MSPKFLYLYLVGGTIALIFTLYQLATTYPLVDVKTTIMYFIPVLLLYYMAYKVYHTKNDSELM